MTTVMSAEIEKASAVLLEFMSAMKEWENKFATLYKRENGGPEVHASQAKLELALIYQKYLTERDRKFGRMAGPSAGWPPEFDPDAEKIVATELPSKRKVVIETLWTHPTVPISTQKHRYTMTYKNGEWRLNTKQFYSSAEGKWVRRVL
jgi:NTF2 fold immunity protein of polymorphic toxin system component